jgi:hypothetical protein
MKKLAIICKFLLISIGIGAQTLSPEIISNSGWYKSEIVELDRKYDGGVDIQGMNSSLFHIDLINSIIETDIKIENLRYSKILLDSIYYNDGIKEPHVLFGGRDNSGNEINGGIFWILGNDGRDLTYIVIALPNETIEFETYSTLERFNNWRDDPLTPTNLIAEQSKYKERNYTEEDIDNFFISMGINPEVGRKLLWKLFLEESQIIP